MRSCSRTRDSVVVSPGRVAATSRSCVEARARGLDDRRRHRAVRARRATRRSSAVTGTNGKSTVTTLVGRMAERGGRARARGRQSRRAGARSARRGPHRISTCSSCRASSSRPRSSLEHARGGGAQRDAGSHGSLRDARRTTRRPRRASSRAATSPSSMPTIRSCAAMPRPGQRVLVVQPRASAARTTRCVRRRREAHGWRGAASRCCRWRR